MARQNELALCRECNCVIAANAVEGHIKWHVQLATAILSAAGMSQVIRDIQSKQIREHLAGKISVVW